MAVIIVTAQLSLLSLFTRALVSYKDELDGVQLETRSLTSNAVSCDQPPAKDISVNILYYLHGGNQSTGVINMTLSAHIR